MVNKAEMTAIENVPDEEVQTIWDLWITTCVIEESVAAEMNDSRLISAKLKIRMGIARWGYKMMHKAIQALSVSPDHDGSRHKYEGSPLIRRSLSDLVENAPNLADYWDSIA